MAIPRSVIMRRRELVARYWFRGHTLRELVEIVQKSDIPKCRDVAYTTISRDVKYLKKGIFDRIDRKIEESRNQGIARLYNLLKEAWIEYNGNRLQRPQLLSNILSIETRISKMEGTEPPEQREKEIHEFEIEGSDIRFEDPKIVRERFLKIMEEVRNRADD